MLIPSGLIIPKGAKPILTHYGRHSYNCGGRWRAEDDTPIADPFTPVKIRCGDCGAYTHLHASVFLYHRNDWTMDGALLKVQDD